MKDKAILLLRLVAVVILLQTLYFKFTGAPESRFIFSMLGVEPWGRWFSGVVELAASLLLMFRATQILGALVAMVVMTAAILSHIFVLGFVIQEDGGLLFGLACVVFLSCLLVLCLQPKKVHTFILYGISILKPGSK